MLLLLVMKQRREREKARGGFIMGALIIREEVPRIYAVKDCIDISHLLAQTSHQTYL